MFTILNFCYFIYKQITSSFNSLIPIIWTPPSTTNSSPSSDPVLMISYGTSSSLGNTGVWFCQWWCWEGWMFCWNRRKLKSWKNWLFRKMRLRLRNGMKMDWGRLRVMCFIIRVNGPCSDCMIQRPITSRSCRPILPITLLGLARKRDLLPTKYFHTIFTVQHELNGLHVKYSKGLIWFTI